MATELLERQDELDRIAALLERARQGIGSVLLVTGEAGAGKTSLVHAAAEIATSDRTVLVLEGACDPLSTPRPLSPLLDIAAEPESGLGSILERGADPIEMFGEVLDRLRDSIRPVLMII